MGLHGARHLRAPHVHSQLVTVPPPGAMAQPRRLTKPGRGRALFPVRRRGINAADRRQRSTSLPFRGEREPRLFWSRGERGSGVRRVPESRRARANHPWRKAGPVSWQRHDRAGDPAAQPAALVNFPSSQVLRRESPKRGRSARLCHGRTGSRSDEWPVRSAANPKRGRLEIQRLVVQGSIRYFEAKSRISRTWSCFQ